MQTLDSFIPFQYPVQVTIDGRTLDYLLTVDETGHVFQAVPVVYDLPPVAQKLILGDSRDLLNRKIRAYVRLFKYLVPLYLAHKLSLPEVDMLPLATEIQQRLQAKSLTWATLPYDPSIYNPAMKAISVFGTNKNNAQSSYWIDAWEAIIQIFKNLNSRDNDEYLSSFGTRFFDVASDFLPAITPLLNKDAQYGIFNQIAYKRIRTSMIKEFLLEELDNPACFEYLDGILSALAIFGSGDKDIFEAVVKFYEQKKGVMGSASDRLMEVLMHHPCVRTTEIGFEIIHQNHSQHAYYAARILIEMGVKQGEILKIMMPHFVAAEPDSASAVFYVLRNCITPELLPDSEDLLDVAVRILSKQRVSSVVHSVPIIARQNETYLKVDELYQLLNHEATGVREMALLTIQEFHQRLKIEFYGEARYLNKRTKIDFKPFTTPRFTECYWKLAQDSDREVARAAIRVLGMVGFEQKRKDYIDLLLGLAKPDSRKDIQEVAIGAINFILERIPYAAQIEPLYLSILESNLYYVRSSTIYGLRFSPDLNFKNALWMKYRDDQNTSVQSAIKNDLFRVPKRSFQVRFYNIINLLTQSKTRK